MALTKVARLPSHILIWSSVTEEDKPCFHIAFYAKAGFVVSKNKNIQKRSKIFSAFFQRLFEDLWKQSAVEKLRV
jgi:hypothetical protein